MADYIRVLLLVIATVVAAVAITFSLNRLDGVTPSLPILQLIIGASMLVGMRVAFRLRHLWRESRKPKNIPFNIATDEAVQDVIIVGLSRLTETYLRSIEEIAPNRIKVAGLVGHKDRHVGRLMGRYEILGQPEDIESILADLQVHGIKVDTIVVAKEPESLSAVAKEVIQRLEHSGVVKILFLAEQLGLCRQRDAQSPIVVCPEDVKETLSFELSKDDVSILASRRYWSTKRFIDIVVAALLLVVLFPVIVFVGLVVAINIGTPIAFWQYRPGLGGRAFKLTKFRTMAPMYTSSGARLSDEQRTSKLGSFLRRTRLDELPQLFNILKGEMSFVGPRPLLPRDQSKAYRARLLVRPGLTGWAQVVGGRVVSAEDKAALDVWYVQHASLLLDLKIIAQTVPMVVFGERTCRRTIENTWRDLSRSGVLNRGSRLSQSDDWALNFTTSPNGKPI